MCLFGNNRSSKVFQFWSNPTQTLLPISLEKESFPEVTNGHKASDLDKDTLHLNGLVHMKRGMGIYHVLSAYHVHVLHTFS